MAIDTLINEAKGMSDQDINEVIDFTHTFLSKNMAGLDPLLKAEGPEPFSYTHHISHNIIAKNQLFAKEYFNE